MGKTCLPLEKQNFERIANSAYAIEFPALGKALNIPINYLIFYPSRQYVK